MPELLGAIRHSGNKQEKGHTVICQTTTENYMEYRISGSGDQVSVYENMICAGRERQLQFIKSEELIMFWIWTTDRHLKKKILRKSCLQEGDDPRILEAASRLLAGTFLHPILIGNPDKIAAEAEECGLISVEQRSLIRLIMTEWMRW